MSNVSYDDFVLVFTCFNHDIKSIWTVYPDQVFDKTDVKNLEGVYSFHALIGEEADLAGGCSAGTLDLDQMNEGFVDVLKKYTNPSNPTSVFNFMRATHEVNLEGIPLEAWLAVLDKCGKDTSAVDVINSYAGSYVKIRDYVDQVLWEIISDGFCDSDGVELLRDVFKEKLDNAAAKRIFNTSRYFADSWWVGAGGLVHVFCTPRSMSSRRASGS